MLLQVRAKSHGKRAAGIVKTRKHGASRHHEVAGDLRDGKIEKIVENQHFPHLWRHFLYALPQNARINRPPHNVRLESARQQIYFSLSADWFGVAIHRTTNGKAMEIAENRAHPGIERVFVAAGVYLVQNLLECAENQVFCLGSVFAEDHGDPIEPFTILRNQPGRPFLAVLQNLVDYANSRSHLKHMIHFPGTLFNAPGIFLKYFIDQMG